MGLSDGRHKSLLVFREMPDVFEFLRTVIGVIKQLMPYTTSDCQFITPLVSCPVENLIGFSKLPVPSRIKFYYPRMQCTGLDEIQQGCGVEGKISDSNSDFPKFPTPAFQKIPTPQHQGNEILLLKSMEIVVQSKKSVSTKVSK